VATKVHEEMFSLAWDQIEAALLALNSGSPQKVAEANELILKWRENPKGIAQAMAIIKSSKSDTVIFQAGCVALVDIEEKWMTYQKSDRTYLRNTLCSRLMEFKGAESTRQKLTSLVVAIALKDYPDEWPDCLDSFIVSMRASLEMCLLDL
jgi:exportin-1